MRKETIILKIVISNSISKPIYKKISTQIKAKIISGELQNGDLLPSIRGLAKMVHVSVITVQKAYDELKHDGFVATAAGRGTFVLVPNRDLIQKEQQRKAEECLQEAAEIGRMGGISVESLIELLKRFYQTEY